MMGSNTFCVELCYDNHMLFAERHRTELIEALLYIKKHLPRTIINLISSPSKLNQIIKCIYYLCKQNILLLLRFLLKIMISVCLCKKCKHFYI